VRGTSDLRRATRLDRRGHRAALGYLALALWLVQASWSPSLARANMIGINFVGKGTVYSQPLAATESAGAPGFTQSNWNNAEGSSNSAGQSLNDENGQGTGTTLTWTYADKSYTSISDTPGDGRMMRGYISQFSSSAPTVTVSGLGTAFTSPGYDVLVYFDGENTTGTPSDWVTQYTLAVGGNMVATVFGKDAAGVNFGGTFAKASGSTAGSATAGNYVRFTGLTASGFTLTATPISGDGPINAIQIIGAPEPASASLLALGLASALAARVRRRALRRRDA